MNTHQYNGSLRRLFHDGGALRTVLDVQAEPDLPAAGAFRPRAALLDECPCGCGAAEICDVQLGREFADMELE